MKRVILRHMFPYILVLLGTFFLGCCILFFKSYHNTVKDKYNFIRSSYLSEFIVQTTSPFDSLNTGKSALYSFNNHILLKDNSKTKRDDLYTLINNNGKKLQNIVIPERSMSVVAYIDSCLFWILDFKLRAINTQEKKTQTIFYKNKIINAIAIDKDKFLTIDTDTTTNNVSFSTCVKTSNSLKCIEKFKIELTDKYKVFQEKALAYGGYFLKAFNYITYSFSHIPYIYVFNNKGKFITSIKTKDNVPYPSVIQYKDYFIFERGNSFNSNLASFVYNNIVCVFSYHAPTYGEITVDCYNLSNGKYRGSISIKNEGKVDNTMIDEIVTTSKYILISSRGRVITLKCTSYQ